MKPSTGADTPSLATEIQSLCGAFLYGLLSAIGAKLFGVYLYGALAFPETGSIGDIDFHVLLSAPLNDEERIALIQLHTDLARDYPPLGGELDGYYLLLQDARQEKSPSDQRIVGLVDSSWALHCAHIQAGRCIVLFGPDPVQIYPVPSCPELELALQSELDYMALNLERYPAYCILNLCRLMYSIETRDLVISKAGAACWAWERFPEWQPAIEAARRSYAGQATEQDERIMELTIRELKGLAYNISSPLASPRLLLRHLPALFQLRKI